VAHRYVGALFVLIGLGALGLAVYGWNVVAEAAPTLDKAGIFGTPESQFTSVAEWQSAISVRLWLWVTMGLLLIATGLGLVVSTAKAWGWPLAFLGAGLSFVLFVVVLLVRPLLWSEFLAAIGCAVGVVGLYYDAHKRKSAF